MADDSRLKATCSFASEATVNRTNSGQGHTSPSPLANKSSLPPSYDDAETIATPPSRTRQFFTKSKNLFFVLLKKYWFLLGLALVIGLACAAPNVARKGGYIRAEWSIKWGAVIVIFLISGLSLRTRILTQTFMRIRLHLLVQIINLIFIPFFVFGLVLLFFKMHMPMNSLVLIGIVIAASTPTTVSSNVVMTKNAKGNEATALMNAAVGNILGIFISPLLVDTFQEPLIEATPENETAQAGGRVDFVSVLKQLGLTVLVPLVIGQIIQIMFTEKVAEIKVKWRLSDVSSVALLLMVYSVFCDAFYNRSFDAVSATDIIAVVIINAGLYILFSLLSLFLANIPFPSSIKAPGWVERLRYSREDTVAVMYCGATKTVAMGVPLINVLYEKGDAGTVGVLSTPLLLYHVEQLIMGNIEVDILKRWVLKGKEQEAKAVPPSRDEEDRLPHVTSDISDDPSSSGKDDHSKRAQVTLSQIPPTAAIWQINKTPLSASPSETVKPDDYHNGSVLHCEDDYPMKQEQDNHPKCDYTYPDTKEEPDYQNQPNDIPVKVEQDNYGRDDQETRQGFYEDEKHLHETEKEHSHVHGEDTQQHEQHEQHGRADHYRPSTERDPTTGNDTQSVLSADDAFFTSPLFTSETASIALDTSRFSSDTLSSRHHSSPLPRRHSLQTPRQQ